VMNGGGLETGRMAPAIARKGNVPGCGYGLGAQPWKGSHGNEGGLSG
jgi:hypothetical protein